MLRTGILNRQLNSPLSRVRHTNTLVIADRGFPFWRNLQTIDLSLVDLSLVDLSLVDDVPRVLEVLRAIRENFAIGKAFMAEEFRSVNSPEPVLRLSQRSRACGSASSRTSSSKNEYSTRSD